MRRFTLTRHWSVVSAVGLLAAASAARSMVVVKRDFPELVARAEQIVIGTVEEIQLAEDGNGAPATLVTFGDLTVVKGDAGPTLTLRFSGGTAGDVAVHISDMPSFVVGERALLFVAGNGRDVCPLVGVGQGRFRVRRDEERGADVVEDNDRVPVTGRAGRELMRARRAPADEVLTLDAFRQLIADELAHPTTEGAASR